MQCTEEMPEGGDDHSCRICGQSFPDRVTRNTHQLKCNGTADLNLQCKYCRDSFEIIETRIRHEGSCTQKQAFISGPKCVDMPPMPMEAAKHGTGT